MKKWQYLIYLLVTIIIIPLWEYKSSSNSTWRLMISSPSLILEYFDLNFSELTYAAWVTCYESILGLLIAILLSFSTIIFCLYIPKLMEFILPIMIISQVIPLITLAPLFIILFGVGPTATILMASLLCYFPIFVNFSNGVKLINKNIEELAFIYNMTMFQKIKRIYFPLAMPNIMAGLKVASTLAVIGAIVAEFSGAQSGLGRNLYISALRTEPELMMSSLFLSSLLGLGLFGTIFLFERVFGSWYIKN